jgi:hypothetical protein
MDYEIIMRQTDYDEETAKQKLEEHNNDIKNVVREFLCIGIKKESSKKTVQQELYKQIREFIKYE